MGDLDREPPDLGRTGRARCWAPHAWANPERKRKRGQPERNQLPPGVKLSQLDQWRTNITISPETTITQGTASRLPFEFLPQVPQKRPLTGIKPTAGQFTAREPKGRETGRIWLLYGCIARRGTTREPGPCRGSCPAPHHLTCGHGWPPDDPQKTLFVCKFVRIYCNYLKIKYLNSPLWTKKGIFRAYYGFIEYFLVCMFRDYVIYLLRQVLQRTIRTQPDQWQLISILTTGPRAETKTP